MRPGRIEKTLERNLSDLDAHLYFLLEEYAKARGGDIAYIKKISNTLRTLICYSSQTEGLLWRVNEILEEDDSVDIHAIKALDKEHWYIKILDFTLIRFWRPMNRPLPYPLVKISFKKFVKECEALFSQKKTYTHEQLIAIISQQMGSSHEAEGVDPLLVELSGVSFSNQPILVDFLLSHANLTLEIGERILNVAKSKTGFQRRTRPEIVIPDRVTERFSFAEDEHFLGREETKSDFTWHFVHLAPHLGWETDGRAHYIGSSTASRMICIVQKPSDGRLEVILYTSSKVMIKQGSIYSIANLDIHIFIMQTNGKKSITIAHSLPDPSTFPEYYANL